MFTKALLSITLAVALVAGVLLWLAAAPMTTAYAVPLLQSNTWTVTSAGDSGVGTLRWCLSQAEPFDLIDFDSAVFPATAPNTIVVTSELPHIITDGLTIDASNAGVILDGSELSGSGDGLHIDGADQVTIHGLQVIGFPDDGIELANAASNAVIGGNRNVGNGPLGQGNRFSGNGQCGILHLPVFGRQYCCQIR
jgi:hypothetical protein